MGIASQGRALHQRLLPIAVVTHNHVGGTHPQRARLPDVQVVHGDHPLHGQQPAAERRQVQAPGARHENLQERLAQRATARQRGRGGGDGQRQRGVGVGPAGDAPRAPQRLGKGLQQEAQQGHSQGRPPREALRRALGPRAVPPEDPREVRRRGEERPQGPASQRHPEEERGADLREAQEAPHGLQGQGAGHDPDHEDLQERAQRARLLQAEGVLGRGPPQHQVQGPGRQHALAGVAERAEGQRDDRQRGGQHPPEHLQDHEHQRYRSGCPVSLDLGRVHRLLSTLPSLMSRDRRRDVFLGDHAVKLVCDSGPGCECDRNENNGGNVQDCDRKLQCPGGKPTPRHSHV
mmetsp:Transcript_19560/g.55142  ORF Transcript_19560/g.55142 Transcript_19560/m.55142 type:complete len:348 (+) Transcript_19560:116-1159(+)